MNHYPIGLIVRNGYWRTLKSVFTTDCKKFILQRIKDGHPFQPVIVIDDTTKKASCVLPNISLTGFEPYTDTLLCRKIETLADYAITKVKIQKSNSTNENKEKYCRLNEVQNLYHKQLSKKDEKVFNKFVKELD